MAHETEIKLVHLTELRDAVNQLRARAGLGAVTAWNPDPDSSLQQNVTTVKAAHIRQLRTKLEEALLALHLAIGGYAHAGPNQGDPIYAIDFQELRNKIKDAWTALASSALNQYYDGDSLRVKKTEYGATTFYVRSSVFGGQVVAELDAAGNWARGYVYAGSSLMAVQQGGVYWMHEDPVTKSKRTTDVNGNVVSAIELDPWGADTNRSGSAAFQPRKYTSYDRDGNGSDEAMFRRYNRKHSRFDQPDPYGGSYDFTDPQSFNRYAYVQNDPVTLIDPSGLTYEVCGAEFSGPACMGDGFWGGGVNMNSHTSLLNGSGQQTVTKNFLSDVRYIEYKWSWYDEKNSVIYSYTLAPFAHKSLDSPAFGGLNPLYSRNPSKPPNFWKGPTPPEFVPTEPPPNMPGFPRSWHIENGKVKFGPNYNPEQTAYPSSRFNRVGISVMRLLGSAIEAVTPATRFIDMMPIIVCGPCMYQATHGDQKFPLPRQ